MNHIPVVEQYMTRMPHIIAPEATLDDAHAQMREFQIRHLPVVSDGKLVGLLSLRDLHLIETLKDVDPASVPVADAMSPEPFVVDHEDRIDGVAAKMAANKIGSAVVASKGELVGIFTTTDALIALLHVWKEAP